MKKFVLEGMDAALDSFTMQEEQENGDLSPDELSQLDSIQIGETFNSGKHGVYIRLPDAADEAPEAKAA